MMLGLHLSLLAVVVVSTVACSIWFRGRAERPIGSILFAILPFVLLGVLSGLLVSATGAPMIEWILPALAVLTVGLTCKSDRVFDWFRWSMPLVALVLFLNFTLLVHGEYTASTQYPVRVGESLQSAWKQEAGNALRDRFGPEEVIAEGPVSRILGDPKYDKVDSLAVERQWHTPITRLAREKRARVLMVSRRPSRDGLEATRSPQFGRRSREPRKIVEPNRTLFPYDPTPVASFGGLPPATLRRIRPHRFLLMLYLKTGRAGQTLTRPVDRVGRERRHRGWGILQPCAVSQGLLTYRVGASSRRLVSWR